MTYADSDKATLQNHIAAIEDWINLYRSDVVNEAVGAVEKIFNEHYLEIRRIRWFSIASPVELQSLWVRFIDIEDSNKELKESVFDFYVGGTSYMQLMAPVASAHADSFYAHVAHSLTWTQRSGVVPDTVRENSTTKENTVKMLKENPWALFLILLSLIPPRV